jgi:hypothetical protein
MVPQRTHARANPARGVALIATAVILGFFILRNGWDQNLPDVDSAGTQAPTSAESAPPPPEEETTASTAPARPPAEITVRVLNAAGVGGAAADWTTALEQAGYRPAQADNAPETRDTTAVLFAAGFDREAAVLAEQIRAPADQVAPLGEPPAVDPAGAQLVVLLGTDLAESAPQG